MITVLELCRALCDGDIVDRDDLPETVLGQV